jgi:NADH-ubiquinone oxidoreductase chain 5
MLLAVLGVSSMVHLFSIGYMGEDPHYPRFFSYLSLFTFGMLLLVTGDNYLVMFVGWELIGVVSFLLISFWHTRLDAAKSALQAFLVNRAGDTLLTIAFFAVATISLEYGSFFTTAPYVNEGVLTLIGLLFLGGAMGKSAQLPLHMWLPNAMEGPTPVSALIHAATLVTAGVYLLLRSSPALEYAPTALLVITLVGAATAFFAATTALLQSDLKRVIAYSTCSQMGYLVAAIGLGQYSFSLFHLVNHAFFKALLFLAAGGLLHSVADEQDQRRLGGLVALLPFTYTALLIGSLSLMALPFLTGFYSKEIILTMAGSHYTMQGHWAYLLLTATAGITSFYSVRLLCLAFLGEPAGARQVYEHTHDQPLVIAVPLVVLSILAIFFGYLAQDLFVGIGSDVMPMPTARLDGEFQPVDLTPTVLTLLAAIAAYFIYTTPSAALGLAGLGNTALGRFLTAKWRWDQVINEGIVEPALAFGRATSVRLDMGALELVGPRGLSTILPKAGALLEERRGFGSFIPLVPVMIGVTLLTAGALIA